MTLSPDLKATAAGGSAGLAMLCAVNWDKLGAGDRGQIALAITAVLIMVLGFYANKVPTAKPVVVLCMLLAGASVMRAQTQPSFQQFKAPCPAGTVQNSVLTPASVANALLRCVPIDGVTIVVNTSGQLSAVIQPAQPTITTVIGEAVITTTAVVTYTLQQAKSTSTITGLAVYWNGLRLSTVMQDFSVNGNVITFNKSLPQSGDGLVFDYTFR